MATFYIIKRTSGWWHIFNNGSKEVNISDFQAVLDGVNQTFIIQNLNGANTPQVAVGILDIIVIDETDASIEETFANVEDLKVRLTALGYTPYLGAGNADAITGLIQEGTNVTITGSGTLADPYVISASGGGTTPNLTEVLAEGDREVKILNSFSPYTFEIGDETKYLYDDDEEDKTVPPDVFPIGAELIMNTSFGNTNILRGAGVQIIAGNVNSDQVVESGFKMILKQFDINVWVFNKIGYSAGGGATNLGYTPSPTNGIVTSDTGTDATIPLADATNAGLLKPAKYTVLENTSGTNTGDNSANTNSNAYSDAKVADAITDGVTTIAPSQNAVFDALQTRYLNPNFYMGTRWQGFYGSANFQMSGVNTAFVYLNNNQVTVASTNGLTTLPAVNLASTAVSGTLAYYRQSSNATIITTRFVHEGHIAMVSNVTDGRLFYGLSSASTANPTNVEPDTLLNLVGICKLSTSNNFHIIHNDGSGTATTIDLGANFPTTTTDASIYFKLTCNGSTVAYLVERLDADGNIAFTASGTLSTNLPAVATLQIREMDYCLEKLKIVKKL